MELWAHKLCPSVAFDDFCDKLEILPYSKVFKKKLDEPTQSPETAEKRDVSSDEQVVYRPKRRIIEDL